jgi:hypothetical protein
VLLILKQFVALDGETQQMVVCTLQRLFRMRTKRERLLALDALLASIGAGITPQRSS